MINDVKGHYIYNSIPLTITLKTKGEDVMCIDIIEDQTSNIWSGRFQAQDIISISFKVGYKLTFRAFYEMCVLALTKQNPCLSFNIIEKTTKSMSHLSAQSSLSQSQELSQIPTVTSSTNDLYQFAPPPCNFQYVFVLAYRTEFSEFKFPLVTNNHPPSYGHLRDNYRAVLEENRVLKERLAQQEDSQEVHRLTAQLEAANQAIDDLRHDKDAQIIKLRMKIEELEGSLKKQKPQNRNPNVPTITYRKPAQHTIPPTRQTTSSVRRPSTSVTTSTKRATYGSGLNNSNKSSRNSSANSSRRSSVASSRNSSVSNSRKSSRASSVASNSSHGSGKPRPQFIRFDPTAWVEQRRSANHSRDPSPTARRNRPVSKSGNASLNHVRAMINQRY